MYQILMGAWIGTGTYFYHSYWWQMAKTDIYSEMLPNSFVHMKIGTCNKVLEKSYAELKRFWEVVSNGRQMAYRIGCPAPGSTPKNKQHLMWAMAEMGWADISVLTNVRDSAVAEMLFIVRADADPSNSAVLFVFCPFAFYSASPVEVVPGVVRYVAFDSAYFDSWGNMLFTLSKSDLLRMSSSSDRIYMDSENLKRPEEEITSQGGNNCRRGQYSNPRSRSPSPVFGSRRSWFW